MSLPNNIHLAHPEKYTLSVRIGTDRLSYTIYEQGVPQSFFYEEFPFQKELDFRKNVEKIIYDNDFLARNFKQTNIIIVSKVYDLVPEHLFDESFKSKIFKFVHFQNEEDVLVNNQKIQSNHLLFSLNKDVHQFIDRNLHNISYFNHTGILIPYLSEKMKTTTDSSSQMCINFHDGLVDILCFSDSKVVQALTYENINHSDIVYYILNVWEKCKFDQLNDDLFIIGSSENILLIINDLKKYIKKISNLGYPSEAQILTTDFTKIPLDLLILAI